VIQLQEIFKFVRTGTTTDGQVRGEFRATGLRPTFMEELQVRGFSFPYDFFEPGGAK
jgi:pilus assembly protein CpaF